MDRRMLSRAGLVGVVLAGGVLGACTTNPTTGRSQFTAFGPGREEEVAMGNQYAPQLTAEMGGEVSNPQLKAYVNEIGDKLKAHTEVDGPQRQWTFTLLDSDVINAFALPGEKVFISRGLADKMTNEAQLAGVLGHEIGHVMARHTAERMSQSTLGQGIVTLGGVLAGGSDYGAVAVQGGELFVGGTLLKFSRDQESEADSLGMRYMAKAGYNPMGQLQVMEILKAASGGGGGVEWMATHPLPETRIDRVNNEVKKTYGYTQSGPDASKYGLYPERFEQRYLSIARTVPVKPTKKAMLDANGRERMLAAVVLEDPMTWCSVCQVNAGRHAAH